MNRAQEIRAANQAATWYQRLEDGLSEAERRRYFRWLKASPANAGALRYLEQLCNSLRTQHKGPRFTESGKPRRKH